MNEIKWGDCCNGLLSVVGEGRRKGGMEGWRDRGLRRRGEGKNGGRMGGSSNVVK